MQNESIEHLLSSIIWHSHLWGNIMNLKIEFYIVLGGTLCITFLIVVIAIVLSQSFRDWITEIKKMRLQSLERMYETYACKQKESFHNIVPPSQAVGINKHSLTLRYFPLLLKKQDRDEE